MAIIIYATGKRCCCLQLPDRLAAIRDSDMAVFDIVKGALAAQKINNSAYCMDEEMPTQATMPVAVCGNAATG
jgi:hypothetical protein